MHNLVFRAETVRIVKRFRWKGMYARTCMLFCNFAFLQELRESKYEPYVTENTEFARKTALCEHDDRIYPFYALRIFAGGELS